MSPNMTSHKSQSIFSSYFWPAIMALFMAVFLSQWAVADPPVEKDTGVSVVTEDPSPTPTEEPMELPVADDSAVDSEGTPDAISIQPTPAVNLKSMEGVKLSDKCYEQTDGSFECVCEGEEECKTLATAEHCEPGTHWGKDGYGGCTKTSDK